jgi:ATP-binding cassette subfamily C protein
MFSGQAGIAPTRPQKLVTEGGVAKPQYDLVAIPHSGTRLIRVDASDFDQFTRALENPNLIERPIRMWVSNLQEALPRGQVVSRSIKMVAGGEIHLTSRGVRADVDNGLVWVRQLSGCSILFGRDELALQEGDGPVPISCGSYLINGSGDVYLSVISTAGVFQDGLFFKGIQWLNELILRYLASEISARTENERCWVQRRIELDSRVFHSAQSQLAAVLEPRSDVTFSRPELKALEKPTESYVSPYSCKSDKRTPKRVNVCKGCPQVDRTGSGVDSLYKACSLVAEKLGVTLRLPPEPNRPVTMLQRLRQMCDSSGLYSRKVLLRGEWWRRDQGPLVAFLTPDYIGSDRRKSETHIHPIALLPSSAMSYKLVDPRAGTTIVADALIGRRVAREAFMLYPISSEGFFSLDDILRWAIHPHWRQLVAISLMAIGGGLLSMLFPIVVGVIYSRVIPGAYRPELVQLSFALLVAALGSCAFEIFRTLSILYLAGQLELSLQSTVWGRLLAAPVSFFRRFAVGDLADRIRGADTIRHCLLGDVSNTVLALAVSTTSFVLLFYYSPELSLLASGLVACLICAAVLSSRFQLRHRQRSLEARGKMSTLAFALVQGISKIRGCGAERRAYGVWAAELARQCRHGLRAQHFGTLQSSFNAFFVVLSELALFALMGFSLRNRLALAGFLAFSAAFGQFQAALLTFLDLVPEVLVIFPTYKRLQPILEERAEADEAKPAVELSGEIEVDNVSFRYQQNGILALDRVSFKARPGEFIAIVGPSGSGKSTLVRLLLGLDRPTSGSIRFDGLDLASLDAKSVRCQIGTVLQNSKPIPGDIFTNIVGGTNNNLESAWEAARIAGIDEEIRAMPMGMYTIIGEGATTFSGGERQRLMIARAVVNHPKIMLLDEATSLLDNPTQAKVQQYLSQLNVTRIVVAHRLSTVKSAHRIYVLNCGRIVEEGTYQDLLKRGGYFTGIADRQRTDKMS